MKVLETRRTPEGFKRRRYVLEDGRTRTSTIEVPMVVWRAINRTGRAADRALQHARELQRQALKVKVQDLARQGWRALAIASELKVPLRSVQRYTSEVRA